MESPIIYRRNAMTINSPEMADADALTEFNINSSLDTKRKAIENLYKTLPDYKISNSKCKNSQYISWWQNNFIFSRFKRWLDEDYYIIEVSAIYKIITVLNVLLIICVMILSYRMWSNNCTLEVVSKNNNEVDSGLKIFKVAINDWLNPIIGFIVFSYSTYRVFKRTTGECKTNPGLSQRRNNVYKVAAEN